MPNKDSATKIKDIDIDEISLVDRAANRRKFAITKKERTEMFEKLIEILKNWLTPEEITEEFQTGIKALPEDVQKAHLATLTVLEEYNDEDVMPAEFKKALAAMVKATVTPIPEKKGGDEFTLDIFIEKAGAVFSQATKTQIEKVIASLQALLGTTKDDDEKKKAAEKNLTPEQIAALEKAAAIIAAEDAKERKAKEDKEKARDEALEKMAKEIADLKKVKGTSKQIGDEGNEGEKGEKKKAVEDKFPSIKLG